MRLHPQAEQILEIAVRRAVRLVEEGRAEDAARAMLVGADAAALLEQEIEIEGIPS